MGRLRCAKTHPQHFKRLHDPVCKKTTDCSSLKFKHSKILYQSDARNDKRDQFDDSSKNSGKSQLGFGLYIADVFDTKTGRDISTNFQPTLFERLSTFPKVSPDKSTQGAIIPSTKRLPGEDRPIPSLPSCTNKTIPSKIPLSVISGTAVQHNLPTIRSIDSPGGVLQYLQVVGKCTATKGNANSSVSGRLFIGPSELPRASEPSGVCSGLSSLARLGSQYSKICLDTDTQNCVLGDYLGHRSQPDNSSRRQKSENPAAPGEDVRIGVMELEDSIVSPRNAEFRVNQQPLGTTLLSTASTGYSPFIKVIPRDSVSFPRVKPHRLPLVESKHQSNASNLPIRTGHLLVDRCLTNRMGFRDERSSLSRLVGLGPNRVAHQSQGALHSASSDSHVQESTRRQISHATIRQQDSIGVHKTSGWDTFTRSLEPGQGPVVTSTSVQHPSSPLLPTRDVQYCSRQTLQKPTPSRLASGQRNSREGLSEMGNSRDRSLCNIPIQGSPLICDIGSTRSERDIHKCIQQTVENGFSLDISTTSTDPQNSPTPEHGIRNLPDSRPKMGEDILERRSEEQESRCPVPAIQSAGSPCRPLDGPSPSGRQGLVFRGLEGTGWGNRLEGLTEPEINLLGGAWRDSSWKTYSSVWKQWLAWCKSKGIASDKPEAHHLVSYLSFLYFERKLAFSSILTQKSTICSLSSAGSENSLGSDPLVKSVLKAIGIQRAKQSKPCKKTIWKIETLTDWMTNHPPRENSIFQVSRFVALQLLLASGRRIHDLTLLSIDPDHCSLSEDEIIFWPEFGSKTDRADSRQSGWQIKKSRDEIFDMVKWIQSLIQISAERRNARQDLSSLFIATRGKVKAASRSVIAGWIDTAFKEAGIQASAGSTRSAVASKNYQNKMCLDELLARGNWKGEKNFFKHYCKEIVDTTALGQENSLIKDFKPV